MFANWSTWVGVTVIAIGAGTILTGFYFVCLALGRACDVMLAGMKVMHP